MSAIIPIRTYYFSVKNRCHVNLMKRYLEETHYPYAKKPNVYVGISDVTHVTGVPNINLVKVSKTGLEYVHVNHRRLCVYNIEVVEREGGGYEYRYHSPDGKPSVRETCVTPIYCDYHQHGLLENVNGYASHNLENTSKQSGYHALGGFLLPEDMYHELVEAYKDPTNRNAIILQLELTYRDLGINRYHEETHPELPELNAAMAYFKQNGVPVCILST